MKPDIFNQKGITLIELMVAMAIAGIVAAAMFAFQQSQTRSYVTQDALVDMQQNARAAMHFMTSELRMAGLDPRGTAGAGIEEASVNMIRFSMDVTDGSNGNGFGNDENITDNHIIPNFGTSSGDTNERGEHIKYELINGNLVRTDHNPSLSSSDIARNLDALNFVYIDANGNPIATDASGEIPAGALDNIRSIQITIIARSGRDAPGFMFRHVDDGVYENQQGDILLDLSGNSDSFRRILVSKEIRLRNM